MSCDNCKASEIVREICQTYGACPYGGDAADSTHIKDIYGPIKAHIPKDVETKPDVSSRLTGTGMTASETKWKVRQRKSRDL